MDWNEETREQIQGEMMMATGEVKGEVRRRRLTKMAWDKETEPSGLARAQVV